MSDSSTEEGSAYESFCVSSEVSRAAGVQSTYDDSIVDDSVSINAQYVQIHEELDREGGEFMPLAGVVRHAMKEGKQGKFSEKGALRLDEFPDEASESGLEKSDIVEEVKNKEEVNKGLLLAGLSKLKAGHEQCSAGISDIIRSLRGSDVQTFLR